MLRPSLYGCVREEIFDETDQRSAVPGPRSARGRPGRRSQTTQVQVIRYASDGTTVANQTTVDVAWMESNLPVFGDGVTPYLFQGPMLNITNYSDPAKWNPAEDTNVDKVNETIKGTYLKDLCNLVGGMQPGGEVKIIASDGFSKTVRVRQRLQPPGPAGPVGPRLVDGPRGLRLLRTASASSSVPTPRRTRTGSTSSATRT